MSSYGSQIYWNKRYLATENSPSYEWYQGYRNLRHLLNPTNFAAQSICATIKPRSRCEETHAGAPPTTAPPVSTSVKVRQSILAFPAREKCRVLILGCGNSTFGEEMVKDRWTGRIVNVDYSSVVIDQMKQKYGRSESTNKDKGGGGGGYPNMEFLCADICTKLPFEDGSFDLIVCKGSFDAVLCSEGSVKNICRLVQECARLLAPGHGIFFLVTHGNPESRIVFLEYQNDLKFYWEALTVHPISRDPRFNKHQGDPKIDYVYICRKKLDNPVPTAQANDGSEENTATNATARCSSD